MSAKRIAALGAAAATLLLAAALLWLLCLRPERDAALLAAHRAGPAAEGDALQLSWYGTTAVLLRAGDEALIIDPFFTRPPGLLPLLRNARIAPDETLIARWLARAGVTQLLGVLVSHSHYDHAMDAGVVARRTGAMLIGSPSTANIGRGAGLDEARLIVASANEPLMLGSFRLRFIESRHAGATGGAPTGDIEAPLVPPARYLDYRQGGTWSIFVEHPQGSVLHHGSAGYVSGALQGLRADTVVLGAAFVEDAESYVREVVDAVGAHEVVLAHWDDFTRPLDQPLRPMPVVVDLAPLLEVLERRSGLAVRTAALGESLPIRQQWPAAAPSQVPADSR